MSIFLTITVCLWLVYLGFRIRKAVHMLQLNSYRNSRLYRWMNSNWKKVITVKDWALILPLIFLFLGMELVAFILLSLVFIIGIVFRSDKPEKKKLAVTARIKRLITTISILYFIIAGVALALIWTQESYLIAGILIIISVTCLYFVLILANVINAPIENSIKNYYYKDAHNMIKQANNLSTIGITGSFGKTSTKFILDTILSSHFNTLKTPESYNTKIGVTITVRNSLKPYHDIFIAEMGAKESGNIKEICELVNHKYAIITAIGEQHLETFKTLENIQKTKYEIVESLPSDGIAFLNKDDVNIMSYKPNATCKKIYFGIDQQDADYVASNIQFHHRGTTFSVKNKRGDLNAVFETKLLGKHNVYNILAAISLAWELNVPLNKLQLGVKKIQPVKHRMEVRKGFGGLSVIDDSFNSNPTGSRLALEVLKSMEGYKILVTPGMIELGDKQYEYNKKFGSYAADACDYVILVGEKQTEPIQDGLKEKNYPADQTYIAKDLNDAIGHIQAIAKQDAIILLENDLPDTYNE
ncbi:UDP-N-acetylmuramoyl-tripeptide--D-alanyl-D-alanine ligase [Saliterribacillus persicus]|uniref:UDP-N-acetylmuramoyl-tripeptide--D-alanyl-D-alanine ligase n=1 Tax=Saliterribacillus persicus TaxID=930114 RepID=A0A368XXU4_9BACI|nr:UDP-N-acetylmuramoyl-tripeptide--D-alanyl-D-alanine ligase [Saliterribacillus persicus]RCW71956.1 UDP-N-acetylmuramoyl-tripeptide--D-alanyl-D-alanine ligase [Saliterribacillus persicus]